MWQSSATIEEPAKGANAANASPDAPPNLASITTEPVRYKQFRQALKGISSKTLASRLKELEMGGILERKAFSEIPLRVEYRMTGKGRELVDR